MQLKIQKILAAQILKCSKNKIWLDPSRLDEIKEAITKIDIRNLINQGIIKRKPYVGTSRFRARKRLIQKRKGRRKGLGSRKGKKTARLPRKEKWISKIRLQRKFLKNLKEKGVISKGSYQDIYLKSKGGFFRSKRHLKVYIEEHGLGKK